MMFFFFHEMLQKDQFSQYFFDIYIYEGLDGV